MSQLIKPILVTGSHKSGTTWVGRNLALAPHTGYIHEPFNIDLSFSSIEKPFSNWFQYICEENASLYQSRLDKVFKFDYPFLKNFSEVKTAKNLLDVCYSQLLAYSNRVRHCTPVVKDPLAFFSSEWLSKTYDMNVLVCIRHPAAFCSSLKLENWNFNFCSLLNQPLLIKKFLYPYLDEITEFSSGDKCILEQAILLWKLFHHTILAYQQAHPEWLFVRHEDLSNQPVKFFRSVYNTLGLNFTLDVERGIIDSSGSHNSRARFFKDQFKRDSKANVKSWVNLLSATEIDLIRLQTSSLSCHFYQDSDW